MVLSLVVRANPVKKESVVIEVESDATHHTSVNAGPVTRYPGTRRPPHVPHRRFEIYLPFFPFPLL